MGIEHKPQDVSVVAIREMAAVLRDYATTLDQAAVRMEERSLTEIPVKHVTKGRTSMQKLGEFVETVSICLRNYMFQAAFPQKVDEDSPEYNKTLERRKKPKPKE